MIKNRQIVCLAPNHWFGLQTSKQHLMTEFAKNNQVIYVEPVTDILSVIFRRTRWYKLKLSAKISPNLTVVSPITLIVSKRNPLIRRCNQFLQSLLLKLRRVDWKITILWSYDPSSYIYFRHHKPLVKLYFIADEYTVHKGNFLPRIASDEQKTLNSADLVFAVTGELQSAKQKPGSQTYLSPNAVNTQLFNAHQKYPVPQEFAGITKALVGVVGSIRDWVDIDLLITVAQKNPQIIFTSVGPGWPKGKSIPENFIIVDQVDYDQVPAYINSLSVGLIPFKITDYTRSTNPLKLYEYLALGKPVVLTDMQGYEAFTDVIFISKNSDRFSENINRALAAADQIRARAIAIARANSWEVRAEFIANKIAEII